MYMCACMLLYMCLYICMSECVCVCVHASIFLYLQVSSLIDAAGLMSISSETVVMSSPACHLSPTVARGGEESQEAEDELWIGMSFICWRPICLLKCLS